MRVEKKTILKEDGRYLVFYHFPDSADSAQREAYEGVEAAAVTLASADVPAAAPPAEARKEGAAHV